MSFNLNYLTPQEMKFYGASHSTGHENPYTPIITSEARTVPDLYPDFSYEKVNDVRRAKGYFSGVVITYLADNSDAVLSIQPLNKDGQTDKDPELFIKDPDSGELTRSAAATETFHRRAKEMEEKQREYELGRDPNAEDYIWSYCLRDKPSGLESEHGGSKER